LNTSACGKKVFVMGEVAKAKELVKIMFSEVVDGGSSVVLSGVSPGWTVRVLGGWM